MALQERDRDWEGRAGVDADFWTGFTSSGYVTWFLGCLATFSLTLFINCYHFLVRVKRLGVQDLKNETDHLGRWTPKNPTHDSHLFLKFALCSTGMHSLPLSHGQNGQRSLLCPLLPWASPHAAPVQTLTVFHTCVCHWALQVKPGQRGWCLMPRNEEGQPGLTVRSGLVLEKRTGKDN